MDYISREKWAGNLRRMAELVAELEPIARELGDAALDGVYVDGDAPAAGESWEMPEPVRIPRWERKSASGIYADMCNLRDAVRRHVGELGL